MTEAPARTRRFFTVSELLHEPIQPKELGILLSFHYYGELDLDEYMRRVSAIQPEIFVDSGGFSAFTQGVHVDLSDYVRWIRRWKNVIHHYANLDVIGNPRESLRNQLRMEQAGLRPIPVVHARSPVEEIRRYKARGYTRQCLGGLVPHMREIANAVGSEEGEESSDVLQWIQDAHEVAREEGVILHGFGATSWPVVLRFPWKTVDSSSWSSGFRFGTVNGFDPKRGKWFMVQLRTQKKLIPYREILREYGVSFLELLRDGPHSRANLVALGARAWLVALRWVRRTSPVHRDLQVFLADANSNMVDAKLLGQTLGNTRVIPGET